MRIYLDNCCYNRPYDDQSQLRISLEAQAKLFIQSAIREKRIELASSYVLMYENSKNPYDSRKSVIRDFIKRHTNVFVDIDQADAVMAAAREIMRTGVKLVDASHVACAIRAECDCFLTTDDRLLKFHTDKIVMTDPIGFIKIWEGNFHE